jgi:hypothetical protein
LKYKAVQGGRPLGDWRSHLDFMGS